MTFAEMAAESVQKRERTADGPEDQAGLTHSEMLPAKGEPGDGRGRIQVTAATGDLRLHH